MKWIRLLGHDFVDNHGRRQVFSWAYDLGILLRWRPTSERQTFLPPLVSIGWRSTSKKARDSEMGLETVDVYLYDPGELSRDGRGQIRRGNVGQKYLK